MVIWSGVAADADSRTRKFSNFFKLGLVRVFVGLALAPPSFHSSRLTSPRGATMQGQGTLMCCNSPQMTSFKISLRHSVSAWYLTLTIRRFRHLWMAVGL
jgi:hypothetical protein